MNCKAGIESDKDVTEKTLTDAFFYICWDQGMTAENAKFLFNIGRHAESLHAQNCLKCRTALLEGVQEKPVKKKTKKA